MVDGLDSLGPQEKRDSAAIGPLHPVSTASLPQQQVRWPLSVRMAPGSKGAQPTSTVKAIVRVQKLMGRRGSVDSHVTRLQDNCFKGTLTG